MADVRGLGLMVGIEMVSDPATLRHAPGVWGMGGAVKTCIAPLLVITVAPSSSPALRPPLPLSLNARPLPTP